MARGDEGEGARSWSRKWARARHKAAAERRFYNEMDKKAWRRFLFFFSERKPRPQLWPCSHSAHMYAHMQVRPRPHTQTHAQSGPLLICVKKHNKRIFTDKAGIILTAEPLDSARLQKPFSHKYRISHFGSFMYFNCQHKTYSKGTARFKIKTMYVSFSIGIVLVWNAVIGFSDVSACGVNLIHVLHVQVRSYPTKSVTSGVGGNSPPRNGTNLQDPHASSAVVRSVNVNGRDWLSQWRCRQLWWFLSWYHHNAMWHLSDEERKNTDAYS